MVAILSLIGVISAGLLTYMSNVTTAEIVSETNEKLQEMDVRVQRSRQANDRATTVAEQYEKLLNRKDKEGVSKRLAFLNLWHLHTEVADRRLLILMASHYAGEEVFELMLVLASELEGHEDLIEQLTHKRECLDGMSISGQGCNVNVFAKQLLSKLAPEKTLRILLETMSLDPLTSPNNANLEILRTLIAQHPDLQMSLLEHYENQYTRLVGLSYLMYQYGTPEPFRAVLASDMEPEKKGELVEFLSGWPLTSLKSQDRLALVTFLGPLLVDFDNPKDKFFLVPTIGIINKIHGNMKEAPLLEINAHLARFVARNELSWPIRSKAAQVLATTDMASLLGVLRDVNIEGNFFLAEDFARVVLKRRSKLKEIYPNETIPKFEKFDEWQVWIKEIHNG